MLSIGFSIELVLGLLYAWSIFVLPLEEEFGWVRAQTSLVFTVSLIFFPAGMFLAGSRVELRGMRLVGSASAMLLASAFLLTSYTGSLAGLVLSFGVLGGLGIGACSNTTAHLLGWFDQKRGLAAGVLSMGFGLGGLVLGSLASGLIWALGWRIAFRTLAGIAFVICFGGFQFLRKPPERTGERSLAHRPPAARDHTPAEMLKAPTFWLLVTWSLLVSTAGVMMIGHLAPLAVEMGISATAAVLAVGALSLANGLGRLFYGALSDRIGRPWTMFLGALFMGCAILLAIPLTRTSGLPALAGVAILVGSSYGGMVPLLQATIMQLFGTRYFGTNLALGTVQVGVSGVLGPQLAGVLRSTAGSYTLPFTVVGVLTLGACLVAVLFGLGLRRMPGIVAGKV
jgi:OFA family oxalate/formate antiporter-like MFS transporter